jgi:hypothetical protein
VQILDFFGNVQLLRKAEQIFVAFSEKLNFIAWVLNLSLNRHGPTVFTVHLEKTLRKKNISRKTFM